MDLSSLSSSLPHSMAVSEAALEHLDGDLACEFKAAAKAVASLYRFSSSKASLLKQKGYLEALDDLLAAHSEGKDVIQWARATRDQLRGTSDSSKPSEAEVSPEIEDTEDSETLAEGKPGELSDFLTDMKTSVFSRTPEGYIFSQVPSPDRRKRLMGLEDTQSKKAKR